MHAELNQVSEPTAQTPLELPFVKALCSLIRAEDSGRVAPGATTEELILPFVVSKEARRALPIVGDPDPEIMQRVELYYRAVAARIEERSGLHAATTVNLSHEGFGRLFITVGRLVAFVKTLRDVHRFGFDTPLALSNEGEKVVDKALANIEEFPAAARASH